MVFLGAGVAACSVLVAAAFGAADWAITTPERATPATSREAITSLRMMRTSELDAADPAGTRHRGRRGKATMRSPLDTATEYARLPAHAAGAGLLTCDARRVQRRNLRQVRQARSSGSIASRSTAALAS